MKTTLENIHSQALEAISKSKLNYIPGLCIACKDYELDRQFEGNKIDILDTYLSNMNTEAYVMNAEEISNKTKLVFWLDT